MFRRFFSVAFVLPCSVVLNSAAIVSTQPPLEMAPEPDAQADSAAVERSKLRRLVEHQQWQPEQQAERLGQSERFWRLPPLDAMGKLLSDLTSAADLGQLALDTLTNTLHWF